MGRQARGLDVREPAAGLLEIVLSADPPPGGWHPGHEIQFRVSPTLGRRYTVSSTTSSSSDTAVDQIEILASTEAGGPGTALLQSLRIDQEITVLAGRHRPLPLAGTSRLHLGDGSSLGTIDAYARNDLDPIVAVEVSPAAVDALLARWPRYHFIPCAGSRGDALQTWLETAIHTGSLSTITGSLLLGHAQTIQRQRDALVTSGTQTRRDVDTRPYWADGKQGL
jgi:NADPH-dependent ferric siderophore reductase